MKAALVLVGLAAVCVSAIAAVHLPAHQTSSIDVDLAGAICTVTKE